MQRKPAAILAADIAGYSRLIAEAEEDTMHRLSDQRSVFEEAIKSFRGRIFNTAGDAIRAEFADPSDALKCALELQDSLKVRNASYPLSKQMNVRIGLALGDVVDQDGDLHGDAVTLASSLEAVAPPGGICVSGDLHKAVSGTTTQGFTDMGELRLKNHPEKVRAFVVNQGGAGTSSGSTKQGASNSTKTPGGRTGMSPYTILAGVAVLSLGAGAGLAVFDKSVAPPVVFGAPSQPSSQPTTANKPIEPAKPVPPVTPVAPAPTKEAKTDQSDKSTPGKPEPAKPDTKTTEARPTESKPPEPAKREETKVATETTTSEPDWQAISAKLKRMWDDCGDADADRAVVGCRALLKEKNVNGKDQALANFYLGKALQKSSMDQAIDAYSESIRLDPTADAYNKRGMAYTVQSDWDRAISDYTECIKRKPESGEAYNNRAWTKLKANRASEAASDAKEAVRLLPNAAYAWDTSGHINEKLGKKDEAIADFRKAISLDSKSDDSRAGLKRLGATP